MQTPPVFSFRSALIRLLLAVSLTAAGWLPAPPANAQQPSANAVLEVKKMTPKSPRKLKMGEKLALEIRYKNPGKGPVTLMIRPSVMTADTSWGIIGGKGLTKDSGKEVVMFAPDKSTTISELEVMMLDAADKKIASINVPVQLVWGDGGPRPAKQPRAP